MRYKWGVLIGVIFLTLVVLLGLGFYYTGGVGLVRLYRNYLSQDIADKNIAGKILLIAELQKSSLDILCGQNGR